MPYTIRHNKKTKKYEIVRKSDKKVVGRSTSKKKAHISISYRMKGEKK